ncbi:SGNH/GDSL hydrolase family protein [Flavobacterium sp. UBA6031]|uniref:SGNH/GDSL hydrolase family protein n=1 Tax=Flavobacterium sp. UBA6031 TaxID=1946551 RepID=UPI0025C5B1D7|nr:SGNH/GDSL hydrolase family protein [Flavobacterium sp. UBA6031]
MRRLACVFIAVIWFQVQSFSQPYVIQESVKKIVFLGNSITYMGQYVSYIEAYMTLRYPTRHIEYINVGLPSETVSGLSEPGHAGGQFPRPDLHERLERVLVKIKPDLVFACYGMNDGIYLPFDEDRFLKFKDGIEWMHKEVTGAGIPIVHITDAVYDERKGKAYSNVLDIYADWLIGRRYTSGWDVIDLHWPMRKYLEDQRQKDSTFRYAEDGIHPNETGHFIMAKQILLYLGETGLENVKDLKSALSGYPNGEAVLKLVEKRQEIMKDAWLTYTGYKRPWMNVGLPIDEALQKQDEIEKQIQSLLK